MNGLTLLLGASALFLVGYAVYSKFLSRVLGIDPSRPTPAHTRQDGCDYVPAHPTVLFGHHFAAIAGAGPIVGPVLAAEFGWASVTLWIVFGCILIGAAHDMIALFLSVRHDGESIGSVIGTILGRPGKVLFLLFSWSALILVVAEFNRQIAGTFVADPAIATASLLFIGEAILFGLCVYRLKMPVLWASLIFVPLMFAFVWIGNVIPFDIVKLLGITPETAGMVWVITLLIYCFFASTCPVWILLQPRDYLNAYLLYAMMALGFLGVFIAHPTLNIDAFAGFSAVGRSGGTDMLFPFLFVTVACGACSGFHSLISTGTTSKQLDNEKNAKAIGYGSMLIESALGIISLIAVGMVSKTFIVDGAFKGAPPVAFAQGIAKMFGYTDNNNAIYALLTLAVSVFALTSLDTGTRLSRFMFSELFLKEGEATYKDAKNPVRKVLAFPLFGTVLMVVIGCVLGGLQLSQIWGLFGAANQLLAGIALMAVAAWLGEVGKNNKMFIIPTIFMLGATLTQLVRTIITKVTAMTHAATPELAAKAFHWGNWFQLLFASAMAILAVVLVVEGARTFSKQCKKN